MRSNTMYKTYTNDIHHVKAKPMTNHFFMMNYEDCNEQDLSEIPKEDGYLVKYADDALFVTSWYPKAIFEKKFQLVE